VTRVRATASARLHFGFANLSLAHERLYGGIGTALDRPRAVVEAEPAGSVEADDAVREATERAVSLLDVPGARVRLVEALPRHVGLGSGTQHALATLAAVARAHGREPRVRERAPALGRGGRSGVGVAAFDAGGFVVDGGHPTGRFTAAPPERGDWTVPPVCARHALPGEWRFVVAVPDGRGPSGSGEDAHMRAVVEDAEAAIAGSLAALLVRRVLPAAAEGRAREFGDAVAEFSRKNGAWYADEQGGVYRPPAGVVVDGLSASTAVAGAGQSSWGPAVWGLTTADRVDEARTAAADALDDAGVAGRVVASPPRNRGATVAPVGGDAGGL